MDRFAGFNNNGNYDSAQQAQVWNLTSRVPSPLILFNGAVNNISTTWRLLYTVSEVTHAIIQEAILANGSAGTVKYALAFLPPTATAPSGSSMNQNYLARIEEVESEKSTRWEFDSGLRPGWRIYCYTDAAAGEFACITVSGVEVTYQ